jgi:hypothetical protein
MSDPRRLLEDPELSPMARAVLRSAEGDRPSSERRAGAARALGLAALAEGAVHAAPVAASGLAWWLVPVILLVGTGGGIAWYVVSDDEPAAPPPPPVREARAPSAEPAPTPDPVPPAPVPAPAPAPAPAIVDEPAPTPAPAPRRTRPAPAPEAAPAPAPTVDSPDDSPPAPPADAVDARRLADEVARLDRARARLAADDAAGCLEVLDGYARDLPNGILVAESELLRIDALLRMDRRADAEAVAREFFTRFPQSPLGRRVRSLLAR